MHGFDNLLDQIQAQPGSLGVLIVGLNPVKFIKDMLDIVRGNSNAGVGNRYFHPAFGFIEFRNNLYPSAGGRIFDRIAE